MRKNVSENFMHNQFCLYVELSLINPKSKCFDRFILHIEFKI